MKNEKGITLVSLGVIIIVILIIAGVAINTSMERFEINNSNKMINDLELLKDKISTYYTKYGVLPIASKYNYTASLTFVPSAERDNCYIIDLSQLEGISLNYGKEGYERQNNSKDVYIINIDTHSIYYVKGVELKDTMYHTIDPSGQLKTDDIPPTPPQLKVISGIEKEDGKQPPFYTSEVEIEIVHGKDNWSGVKETKLSYTKDGTSQSPVTYGAENNNNILKLSDNGVYILTAKTYDNMGNVSETTELKIEIHIVCEWNEGVTIVEPTCTTEGEKLYTCINTRCGATKKEEVSELEHLIDSGTITKAATCTTDGEKTYSCQRTNCTYSRTEIIDKLGHDYEEIITGATCTTAGVKTYRCTRPGCGHTETETIPALGHTEVVDARVEATCTTTGLTEGKHCSKCNAILTARTTIPVLGHSWKEISRRGTATCHTFETVNEECNRCGETRSYSLSDPSNHGGYLGRVATNKRGFYHVVYNKCSKCTYSMYVRTEFCFPNGNMSDGCSYIVNYSSSSNTGTTYCCECGETLEGVNYDILKARYGDASSYTNYQEYFIRKWWKNIKGYEDGDIMGS